MINRRDLTIGSCKVLGAGAMSLGMSGLRVGNANAVEINDDGLHVQDWFLDSFMEIADEQSELNDQNKHLAVMFEQRGCPYCREMHEVNLAIPEISTYIQKHFGVLQINIRGSKNVTDLDGTELPEKDFARKWRVNFTPSIVFLRQGDVADIPLKLAEAARMPGYLKPFHFLSMFEFVAEKHYEKQVFQRFLQDKFDRYKAEGKDPDVW